MFSKDKEGKEHVAWKDIESKYIDKNLAKRLPVEETKV